MDTGTEVGNLLAEAGAFLVDGVRDPGEMGGGRAHGRLREGIDQGLIICTVYYSQGTDISMKKTFKAWPEMASRQTTPVTSDTFPLPGNGRSNSIQTPGLFSH
jgi:hypothetical protein